MFHLNWYAGNDIDDVFTVLKSKTDLNAVICKLNNN